MRDDNLHDEFVSVLCRDCSGHDVRNKSGDGDVLGDVPLERYGDHGDRPSLRMKFCQCLTFTPTANRFVCPSSGGVLGGSSVQPDPSGVRAGRVSLFPEGQGGGAAS